MMGTPHDAIGVIDSSENITATHDLESIMVDSGSTSGIQLEVFVAGA